MAVFNGTGAGDLMPLALLALGDDEINGLGGDDILAGFSGDDVLNGGTGADLLIGGVLNVLLNVGTVSLSGNDTASYATSASAVNVDLSVVEDLNVSLLGIQVGLTDASRGFGGEAEGDILVGINNLIGSGSNDRLGGNASANALAGGAGNDTLVGGGGADTLAGGTGSDIYINPNGATILELAGEGTADLVQSDTSFSLASLAQVEHLTLTGMSAINGTGNAGVNSITGNWASNQIDGGDGHDALYGSFGNDVLIGGLGNDLMVGGGGADTLSGGEGNDTYVNPTGDTIVELAGQGTTDRVQSDVAFSLEGLSEVEQLALTGSAAIDGTGHAGNNGLFGNSGANSLYGLDGNDTLTGGDGVDMLYGGAGNDTYVNPTGDTIVDTSGTVDIVQSDATFSIQNLAGIEHLTLTGSAFINGTGSAGNNVLTGNFGSNVLTGLGGNDHLFGSLGSDTLIGGEGNDFLIGGLGRDTMSGDAGADIFRYVGVADSTGVGFDFITSVSFTEDRFDFTMTPTSLADTITTGTLNVANFSSDLQAAVNGANFGINQAVLFDPDGGDLNLDGQLYLVVDANGIAGYQADQDYVVQLGSTSGTLGLSNFI